MLLSQITELGYNHVFSPCWYLFSLQWWAQGHKDAPMDNCSEKRCSGGMVQQHGIFLYLLFIHLEKTEHLMAVFKPSSEGETIETFLLEQSATC